MVISDVYWDWYNFVEMKEVFFFNDGDAKIKFQLVLNNGYVHVNLVEGPHYSLQSQSWCYNGPNQDSKGSASRLH